MRRMMTNVCVWVALLLISAVSAACGPAQEPTPTIAPVATPTPTTAPVATPTPKLTAGAIPPMPEGAGTPRRGGVLQAAVTGVGQSHFDIYQFDGFGPTGFFANQLYNSLVRMDRYDPAKIAPMLAETWFISDEGRTLTFKIRPGVTWHDGTPLSAADVVATYNFAKGPPKPIVSVRAGDMRNTETIEAIDENTVVIRLKQAQPDFLPTLGIAYMPIYPKHLLEPLAAKGEGMKFTLVGTGPFKKKDFQADTWWEVERNPNYYNSGLPYLDGIRWTYTPDETLRLAAFKTGRVHIPGGFDQEGAREEAKSLPLTQWVQVASPNISSIVLSVDKKPFDDVRVRQAIALTMDRRAFLDAAKRLTVFSVSGAGFTPGSPWSLPEERLKAIPGYGDTSVEVTRQQARELLKAAGYPDKVEFTLSCYNIAESSQPCLIVHEQLNKVPFNVKLDLAEYATYYSQITGKQNVAVVHAMTMKNVTVDGILGECCTSAGRRNFGRYQDSELDQLFSQQSQQLDISNRRDLVYDYQVKWLSRYYHVQLGWGTSTSIFNKAVHGFWPHVNPANSGWYEGVWLES